MSASINRRLFVLSSFAALLNPDKILALNKPSGHFYWLDFSKPIIHLPADNIIESGQPGSIMKLITSTAILEENLPSATKKINCTGRTMVAGQWYVCQYPHGRLSIVEAIGQSCNVFFAQASKDISIDCWLHYLKKFGLGHTLEIQPSSNNANLVLGIDDRPKFSAIDILQLAISIANRGQSMDLELGSGSSQKIVVPDTLLKDHTWNILQTGMYLSCKNGTAKKLDIQNKLHIACKTGTTAHGKTFKSWITGYFPYEKPRYAFCLRAPYGTSFETAVPMARQYLFARDWS